MLPILFEIPVVLLLLAGGGFLGSLYLPGAAGRPGRAWLGAGGGALLGLALGAWRGWLGLTIPLRGYGVMITLGFLTGVWMARRRALRLGVAPSHCLDIGLWGLVGGLLGARLFHVAEHWPEYSPWGPEGWAGLTKIFKLWEGGLVFYGAFVAAIAICYLYCRWHRLPWLPLLDLTGPSMIMGQALGRLGCFLYGCCYGKVCQLPWRVRFPIAEESPFDLRMRMLGLQEGALDLTPALHPTQLYAFVSGILTALFLYCYWPRRRYDGQVFGLMLTMAAAARFFEEFLRADTPAAFPSLSQTLTIAQWIALALVALGLGWILYFRARDMRYRPAPGVVL